MAGLGGGLLALVHRESGFAGRLVTSRRRHSFTNGCYFFNLPLTGDQAFYRLAK